MRQRTYQLSVSDMKTPWSVVRPFPGFLAVSKVAFWRSATLAVWPVTEVNASLTDPMAEDIMEDTRGMWAASRGG